MGLKLLGLLFLLVVSTTAAAEPWQSCYATPLPDADATSLWNSTRTTNNWDPNWSLAFPARSMNSSVTTNGASSKARHLLANKRWLVLFDEFGRIRGITDRRYAQEFIRDDADAGGWNPSTLLLNMGTNQTNQYSADVTGTIDNNDTPTVTTPSLGDGTGLQFQWTLNGLTITQRWWLTLSPADPGIKTDVSVTGTGTGTFASKGLVKLSVVLAGLTKDGTQDVLAPISNEGAIIQDIESADESIFTGPAPYPSSSGYNMQFVAVLNDSRHGLYIGLHDPLTQHVRFLPRPSLTAASFFVDFFPENSGSPGNSIQTPPLTVLPICSEQLHSAVAKTYRNWSHTQSWALPTLKVSQRTDKMKGIDLWMAAVTNPGAGAWSTLRSAGSPPESCAGSCTTGTVDDMQAEEYPGVNIAHWAANWDTPIFDQGNPIKATKSGVDTVNAALNTAYPNSLLMAYVEPRHVDLSELYTVAGSCNGSTATATAESHHDISALMAAAVVKAEHVEPCDTSNKSNCKHITTNLLGPGVCFAELTPVDPTTLFYADAWADRAVAANFPAIYWDTVGIHQCNHKEGLGYSPGCHPNMFTSDQANFQALTHFGWLETREYGTDYMNREIPNYINWVEPEVHDGELRNTPLYGFVYHDWVYGGGHRVASADDAVAFGLKVAMSVAWGTPAGPTISQPVGFTNGTTDGVPEAAYKRVAAARTALAKYLREGELLGVATYSSAGTSATISSTSWCENQACSGPESITTEAVIGAWWRGSDGSYALIYANGDTATQRAAYFNMLPGMSHMVSQDCAHSETKGACAASPSTNFRNYIHANPTAGAIRVMYFDHE